MAEDDSDKGGSSGGGGLKGTVKVPGMGPVKKKTLAILAGGAAAFVLFMYWRARSQFLEGEGEEILPPEDPYEGLTDSGFGDGAVSGYDADRSSDTTATAPRSNAEWSQLAKERLLGSYEPTAIDDALGRYLSRQPLTAQDQRIVQAAIAQAGYPPTGTFTIISGGDADITVAPTGVKATAKNSTTLNVTWNKVDGAHEYRLYRSGVAQNVGTSRDTKAEIGGLQPGVTYTVYVRAVSASGKQGPRSSGAKGKTKTVTLKKPTGLKVRKTTKTTAYLTWNTVPGADGYRMYHNKASGNVGASGDGKATVYGLKPRTTYYFHVRALDHHGNLGPASSRARGRTKK